MQLSSANPPYLRLVTDDIALGDTSAPATPSPDRGYAATLQAARVALWNGQLDTAEDALMRAGTIAGRDPDFFNVLGVLHELRGRTSEAKRAYAKAIRAKRRHVAAQKNMRRLYELATFGRTSLTVALGDETTQEAGASS